MGGGQKFVSPPGQFFVPLDITDPLRTATPVEGELLLHPQIP